MNRIYRLVFNRRLGLMQVTSEVATQTAGGSAASPQPHRYLTATRLAAALGLSLASGAAFANCVGTTAVTCDATTNQNAYANSNNNIQMDIAAGARLSVLPLIGGAAVSLTGNGITVNNAGTIDPTINGGLSLAAAGLVVGNDTVGGNSIAINNQAGGSLNGLVNIGSIFGVGGQALLVQNAAGGVTTITNSGTVDMSILGV
ncbi:MAG: hypothetical protein GAK31_02775 [Stenotrophomonas maltophilia]|uniref:ESPR domain-containing protein n=1 Tax=Stenotrophomonas maltophilia TaxID=40324 RepID=A0A7V8JKP7_STEMA|nr:MAG: hypothetical protein GAK31_02775 [Stenotrophomonas maltophilia]